MHEHFDELFTVVPESKKRAGEAEAFDSELGRTGSAYIKRHEVSVNLEPK